MDDVEIDRRLENWRRWKAQGSGALGHGTSFLARLQDEGRALDPHAFKGSRIPLWDTEAAQTEADICSLEAPLTWTLLVHVVGKGSLEGRLSVLQVQGFGVSQSGYYARIKHARSVLWSIWAQRASAIQAEAVRVRQLTDAARPPDSQPLPPLPKGRVRRARGGFVS